MNETLITICKRNHIVIDKIYYYPNYLIIESTNKKYLFEKVSEDILSFLREIDYPFLLDSIDTYDSFSLFPYYEDLHDKCEKGKKMMEALSLLQQKTLLKIELLEDEKKDTYQMILARIENEMNYYLDLQKQIEEEEFFPRVDYYYLLLNISMIYQILFLARDKLDSWFSQDSILFKGYCLKDVSFSNFRFGEEEYFIDYRDSSFDFCVYQLALFYQKNYLESSMRDLFMIYEKNIPLSSSEWDLLYSLICIPKRIKFLENTYQNTVTIQKTLEYIDLTFQFVSEKDKENQETNK